MFLSQKTNINRSVYRNILIKTIRLTVHYTDMNFLAKTYTSIKKSALHFINPNENPTEFDRYAFNLLQKAEVDLFI